MDLLIFNGISEDTGIKALLGKNTAEAKRSIINFAERYSVSGNSVCEYLINALTDDDNILAQICACGKTPGTDLKAAALEDLELLYDVFFNADFAYIPSSLNTDYSTIYSSSVCRMTKAQSPAELLELLIEHYSTQGFGVLSRYAAYKFDENGLHGVCTDTSVTFSTLVGLEYQKKILIDNTRDFMAGRPSNNVLLFGDRGTGKSSCIKAMLNMLAPEGLRMIELPKHMISKIPELSSRLAELPHKYILFLDDLTFERHDSEYRALKIAMDGQLQANPDNVIIYATSNRRHLIKETLSDREGGEVHRNDNMQETLSLSERFGISLVFSSPTQKEYLAIVEDMLSRHGIEMTPDIEKAAVRWQMNYGGRNPRLAKQFTQNFIAGK